VNDAQSPFGGARGRDGLAHDDGHVGARYVEAGPERGLDLGTQHHRPSLLVEVLREGQVLVAEEEALGPVESAAREISVLVEERLSLLIHDAEAYMPCRGELPEPRLVHGCPARKRRRFLGCIASDPPPLPRDASIDLAPEEDEEKRSERDKKYGSRDSKPQRRSPPRFEHLPGPSLRPHCERKR
jgi:hypothetical protein